jgi:putative ABC transport system permease protein
MVIYLKTFTRTFKTNFVRLCVIIALAAISQAIISGIGVLAPRMRIAIALIDSAHPNHLEYLNFLATGIQRISYVFPALFIVVTALVVYMTITRLVESERPLIGCFITQGYSRKQVIFKYMVFTFTGCLIGCILGLVLGYFAISPVLYPAIARQLSLPATSNLFPHFGLYSSILLLFFTLAVTFLASFKTVKEKPLNLFLPKTPKAGRKTFLESVPFVWNKLKFKHKSTLRNVFRFKVRLSMTVFSMLFSTTLVFCGISLAVSLRQTNPELIDLIENISTVLVIAAILLNTLVVYNITNINIEERKREIATLMVLGYKNAEVAGYIFREIFILTVFGVALGLPAGTGAMFLMFDYLRFGGMEHVAWYTWVVTAALAFSSLGLANLLLYKKLVSTDMNASLKTNE